MNDKLQAAKTYLRDREVVNLYQRPDGSWAPPKAPPGSRVLSQWMQARSRLPGRWIGARAFDAARVDRLTARWTTTSSSADTDIRNGLLAVRARSRDLADNNPYAKRFLQMVESHVIGPQGFALQMSVPSSVPGGSATDDFANTLIETAWKKWGKARNCDLGGKLSFRKICAVAVRSAARDGEALIRIVRRNDLVHGIALQLLEADRLDERLNGTIGDNRLVMGIEIDPDGRAVNYHLRTRHPGDQLSASTRGDYIEIVPAADIVHLFTAERAEQRRGIPWMHAAMKRLRDLGNFEDSAVIAAHVGAAKMGFFQSGDSDGMALANAVDAQSGALIDEVEPGTFQQLPPGYTFQSFNPDYPSQNFDPFVKACLRGVAAGVGASYHILSGDLTDVNFSSIRAGTLEEREGWMALQSWMAETMLDPIFEAWLDRALLTGALAPLSPASRDRYLDGVTWQGRRWQWVDPVKDIEASKRAVELGVKSRRQICAEQGVDFDDVVAQIARENQQMVALGLATTVPDVPLAQPAAEAAPA